MLPNSILNRITNDETALPWKQWRMAVNTLESTRAV